MIENLVAAGKMEPKYHAQSRPPVMQADGVARALRVGEVAKAPVFIVHVSCEAAMNEIVRSRDEGNAAFGETCTQYLFLDETYYDKPNFEGAKYVFTPPLVAEGEHRAAVEGAEARLPPGSQHRPLPVQLQGPEGARPRRLPQDPQRRAGRGGPPVARLRRRDEARLQPEQVGRHHARPRSAKMFGMFPKKGTIAVGSDADIVIFDPEHRADDLAPRRTT